MLLSCVISLSAAGGGEAPRVVVGPNILVSRDGDVAHCETMIAANPRDPKNLLGASITFTKPDGGGTNKVYASLDGGSTWSDAGFQEEMKPGFGGDPQVAFGPTGTAFFVGLFVGDKNSMNVYRSEDGGRTWQKPVVLAIADHEQLVVDQTTGPYAGRIYLTGETHQKGSKEIDDLRMQRKVVLYRSSDDGRSFIGPVDVESGGAGGLGAMNLLVFPDGMLWIPMLAYPNYATDKKADTWKILVRTSSDGGVTLSPTFHSLDIRFGGAEVLERHRRQPRTDQISMPAFAVDATSGEYRNRLYAAWTEWSDGRFRLLFAYSTDRGKTWSKAKPLDAAAAPDSSQFQPMIAVNPDGVLGAFWYDTAGSPKRDRYDVFFTASLDGGQSFLPKARVSSETSNPLGPGNMRPGPILNEDRGMLVVNFLSGFSRYPSGGDYIGMTADGDGAFHPFWSDARSGTFQLYSARIRVEPGEGTRKEASAAARAASEPKKERVSESLIGRVTLEFDPVRYDAQTRELSVPVRLKNVSDEPLYPPFRVEVKETAHPYTVKSGSDVPDKPAILNAVNGKEGEGAIFDYSNALQDLEALEPGGVTNSVVWRLRVKNPSKTDFHLGLEVTGFVQREAP
jgi:hypothetical protein